MSDATTRSMRREGATAAPVIRDPAPARGAVSWLLAVTAVGMAALAVWVASGALW